MSSLYDLIPATEGYQFINQAGDQYYVYLTAYSLLDPRYPDEQAYVNIYMLGFSCKRFDSSSKQSHDAKSKATILFIFNAFIELHPEEAFIYICDNRDGFARNRRVTFGRWFHEANKPFEQHHSHISYGNDEWYSAILIKNDNLNKEFLLSAYYYTLKQMLNNMNSQE